MKNFYKNPMSKIFCYEYALYMLLGDRFAGISCKSLAVDSLRMHYADLVKEKKKKNNPYAPVTLSYQEQYDIEELIDQLVRRDVIGKVSFPGMHLCRAEVKVRTLQDGSHTFLFTDGIYAFEAGLSYDKKGEPAAVRVRNLRPAAEPETTVWTGLL